MHEKHIACMNCIFCNFGIKIHFDIFGKHKNDFTVVKKKKRSCLPKSFAPNVQMVQCYHHAEPWRKKVYHRIPEHSGNYYIKISDSFYFLWQINVSSGCNCTTPSNKLNIIKWYLWINHLSFERIFLFKSLFLKLWLMCTIVKKNGMFFE